MTRTPQASCALPEQDPIQELCARIAKADDLEDAVALAIELRQAIHDRIDGLRVKVMNGPYVSPSAHSHIP